MEELEKEKSFHDYLRVFYKHRWAIVAFFLVVVAISVVVTLTMKPVYMASTRILIEKETPNIVDFKELYAIDATTKDFFQTQYKILESRSLAEKVIDELDLWNSGELNPGSMNRFDDDAEELSGDELMAMKERVINRFLSRLDIIPVRNTRLVEIRFSSRKPLVAAKVANVLVDVYMKYTLQTKLDTSVGISGFLSEKIREQRAKLEESEQLLQQYKEQFNIISLEEEEKIAVSKLAKLSSDLLNAEKERIELGNRF